MPGGLFHNLTAQEACSTRNRPGSLFYQRLELRLPPPPPLPPAPDPLGRASLTLSERPSRSAPLSALIALSPSESTLISMNAKPRGWPESRSVTMLTRSTFPYDWNIERSESSVVPKLRLPTKMFFITFFLKLE